MEKEKKNTKQNARRRGARTWGSEGYMYVVQEDRKGKERPPFAKGTPCVLKRNNNRYYLSVLHAVRDFYYY